MWTGRCGRRLCSTCSRMPSSILSRAVSRSRLAGAMTMLRLAVADTGVGIPSTELPRLFERFHRVKGAKSRTHEGTGIGLALVRELVSLHGGTISIESDEGRGSTFTVTIKAGTSPSSGRPCGQSPRAGLDCDSERPLMLKRPCTGCPMIAEPNEIVSHAAQTMCAIPIPRALLPWASSPANPLSRRQCRHAGLRSPPIGRAL